MNFDFFNVPRFVFGRGAVARLWEFIPSGARVLLVYNGREIDGDFAARVRQRGEPTVADVDAALAVARKAPAMCLSISCSI